MGINHVFDGKTTVAGNSNAESKRCWDLQRFLFVRDLKPKERDHELPDMRRTEEPESRDTHRVILVRSVDH